MSQTVMTAAFGPTDRYRGTPRGIDVLADLVVGGSAVVIFHCQDGSTLRLRPDGAPLIDTLMAGFALAASVPLDAEAESVAVTVRTADEDTQLTPQQTSVLKKAVARLAVTAVVTWLDSDGGLDPLDFGGTGWTHYHAVAHPVTSSEKLE